MTRKKAAKKATSHALNKPTVPAAAEASPRTSTQEPLPPAGTAENHQPPGDFSFSRVIIDRGDDVVIEIELCHGDITETPSKVILLGQVQGLDPITAAISLDEAMNGALFRLLAQRGSGRGAGDLDIIPTGRHPIMAELIAFLSLGKWENFGESSQEGPGNMLASAARSGLHSLLASSFDEFSTVLMGGRRPDHEQIDVEFSLRHMLRGFIQALREDPERARFRRVVIVEQDIGILRAISDKISKVVHDEPAFDGVRAILCGSRLPVRMRAQGETRGAWARPGRSSLLNLSLSPLEKNGAGSQLVALLQPAIQKGAVVVRDTSWIGPAEIPDLYDAAGVSSARGITSLQQLAEVTRRVGKFLPAGILEPLTGEDLPRIELVHDAEASRVPWETLSLPDGRHPALLGGFSRRFISGNARILWNAAPAAKPRILMLIDPTGDLPDAAAEGQKLKQTIRDRNLATVTYLEGAEVNKKKLMDLLNTEVFDILHYAGHSVFNRENPKSSGLLLNGKEYFTGADALGLSRFPTVIVFNSCESARIRRLDPVLATDPGTPEPVRKKIEDRDAAHGALSIAEAFLIAGVHHYIGTFWPVNDHAATIFATTLYTELAGHKTAGTAVTAARCALESGKDGPQGQSDRQSAGRAEWANYIHYGDPDTVIFPAAP